MIARRLRCLFSVWLVASLAGCATTPRARDTGELVFWRVARADGSGGVAHLLGSMHVAKETIAFDPAIQAAFAAADEIVLEVAPSELGSSEVSELIVELGRLPEGRTLADFVSAETLEAVRECLEGRKMPLSLWLGWEPWVLSLALASDQLESEGFSRAAGVEQKLAAEATQLRKPTRGLETTREQIERLDALPQDTQELLLRDAVGGAAEGPSVDSIGDAWLRGDLAALARAIFATPKGPAAAAYFEAIYFARNRDFAADIAALVDAGGSWFVALGVGHMVGDQAIPELLAERGLRVERVPKTRTLAPRAPERGGPANPETSGRPDRNGGAQPQAAAGESAAARQED